ncbi:MAG: competence/damage-inducible protein A [Candidatus Sericytochromatia bacterium]|nr:competence/damage-inducible protein A [Candidatus Tanganyikabacteria bacterium]
MLAEILSIGTELLIGQVVNTNATWLARRLALLGIDVHRVVTVGDNMARLCEAVEIALGRADLVVCTGGLGPTADDITIEAVARVMGDTLEQRPDVARHIEEMFSRRGRPMSRLDLKQALFPPSAELIPNPAGTAFGLCIRRGEADLMAFPGVPSELEAMWQAWAEPRLAARAGATIRSTLLKYAGCTEAELAELVSDAFAAKNPTVAPYTNSGEVHLRVTAKAVGPEEADALLAPVVAGLIERGVRFFFGRDDDTLPSVVGSHLRAARQTLAVAESATGGLLASRITDVPGSSDYFRGGCVAYSVDAKVRNLGVPSELIAAHGAVSRETTEAMAQAARHAFGAEWGIGTTGWAGPSPGVAESDVGLVYICVAGPGGALSSREYRWGRHAREQIKHFATQRALATLLRKIKASQGSLVGER